ncbi:cold shock domain-containing protein, partial [Tabrizicola sp.]|uniref:cold-shock protein n=1 Tax=Tabrizicola sp. TaxID=2005166 RepID=UPI00286CD9D1
FDKIKGFGFANVFGKSEDVFIHIEVLRVSGFADLITGEAVALRIVDGKRGRMAVQVVPWETVARDKD